MSQPPDAEAVFTDRYDDRGRFGLGASADVRRAFDRRMEREVALKVVRLDRATDHRAIRRIRSEAILAGSLFHTGIPPIFDRDVLTDGRPFFTMRAINGISLMDETIRFHRRTGPGGPGGRQALRSLVHRMVEVAEAVDAAHGTGIIHRDLKLANVMLPYIGPAQVVDWGLAVDLANPPTRLGRAGTRGYMPPEQEVGRPSALAPTADVYALGEMLARILFGAGHDRARPSHPAHAPPDEFARVCAIARSPDPSDRYADAGELRNALRNALHETRVAAPVRPRLAV
jgi:serine/threonine protein kinase